jgi:hypothetical protein
MVRGMGIDRSGENFNDLAIFLAGSMLARLHSSTQD